MTNKELREMIKTIIREEVQDHLIEEGIVNWLLDKTRNFVAGHFNHVADYQYARLMKSNDFKALHKKFGMSEKDFMTKATKLVKQNPQKFADLLAYDVRKGGFGKYFK